MIGSIQIKRQVHSGPFALAGSDLLSYIIVF